MTRTPAERACEYCGVLFTPKRSNGRFHSNACRAAYARDQRLTVREPYANRTRTDNQLATVTPIRAEPLAWDPPGDLPELLTQVGELCGCGESLYAPAGRTLFVCFRCKCKVIPDEVLKPYRRGPQAASPSARQVVSQRERDAESRGLAVRFGDFRREIERQLADDRLTPQSRDILEWYAAETAKAAKAKSAARLDDLIEQARGERLRRRHWWDGEPAAIGVGEDSGDDEEDDDYPEPAALVERLAITAGPAGPQREMTWPAAASALGWGIDILPGHGCQIMVGGVRCGADAPLPIGENRFACPLHHGHLSRFITRGRRPA